MLTSDWSSDVCSSDLTTLMAESEELKKLLMKVKEESEKVGLKLNKIGRASCRERVLFLV